MKSSNRSSRFPFQRTILPMIVLTVLLGSGQPAWAGIYDTFRSWSYYTDRDSATIRDDHYWSAESMWQGESSVQYDADNYAKSLVGFDSDGRLTAKSGVSANDSIYKAYTSSYYRDDGFQCGADSCGTMVPLGGSFQMNLKQDGRFTLGSANYSLSYYLRTPSTAYGFHFAVQQGEMDLEPYGWFSEENLVSGAWNVTDLSDDPSFFNLVWEDDDDDGIYNFAYDVTFSGNSGGIDMGEELIVTAYAYGSSPDNQFVDSYNSFYASVTPGDGSSFYRGDQLVGTVVTPEPLSMVLFGLGGGVMAFVRRKQLFKNS